MTLEEFRASIAQPAPPPELPAALRAMWEDARGNWSGAHTIAQDLHDADRLVWIHAYLHRREGDLGERKLLVSPRRTDRSHTTRSMTSRTELSQALL